MQKTITHKLLVPVEFDGATVTEITLRRPKGRDMKRAANTGGSNPGDATAEMIANLAEISPKLLDELDGEDWLALAETVGNFMEGRGAGARKPTA
jgi:hypothetical protein